MAYIAAGACFGSVHGFRPTSALKLTVRIAAEHAVEQQPFLTFNDPSVAQTVMLGTAAAQPVPAMASGASRANSLSTETAGPTRQQQQQLW